MNLFPSTVFLPEGFEMVKFNGVRPATIWRGAALHFLAVFSKKKILWKLWLSFSKMFHQRAFPDWKWSISKFQFSRQILNIERPFASGKPQTANRKPQSRVCSFASPRFQTLARRSAQFSSFLFRQNIIQYKDIYRNCNAAMEPRRNHTLWSLGSPVSKK